MTTTNCPRCGEDRGPGDSGWPIEIDGEIHNGGCQNCWEADCDESWWDAVCRLPPASTNETKETQ